jgi:hypothetical protein
MEGAIITMIFKHSDEFSNGSGMAFQAGVGSWFAAYIVGEVPIRSRFGLPPSAILVSIQFETGEYLDDIVVQLSECV